MEFVAGVHHAVEQFAILIGKLAIDVEVADFLAIGELAAAGWP
jgi:hypothetical protein